MEKDFFRERTETFEFLSNPNPPTLDDIVAAVHNNKVICSSNISAMLEKTYKNRVMPVEQFNFGRLSYAAIREAQNESLDFVEHGYFKPPYPVCLYRCNIEYEPKEHSTVAQVVGTTLLVVDGTAGDTPKTKAGIATVMLMHSPFHMVAMHSINMLLVKDRDGGRAVELQIPKDEFEFWKSAAVNDSGRAPTLAEACDGSMLMMGLTMILNTRGVLKERKAPPEKPNKARARAGKPPLPYVTHVYTATYMAASDADRDRIPGTHASPRPHRRRAHVRQIPARHGHAAYVVPIEAMLVNWDGTPIEPRKAYDVIKLES